MSQNKTLFVQYGKLLFGNDGGLKGFFLPKF